MTTADERFRIHVPQPDTELVLGKGDNNFVGIMGRVDDGGVFFGAGASLVPLGASTYENFKKAHSTLGVAVGGVAAVGLFTRTLFMGRDTCILDAILNGLGAGAAIGMATLVGMDKGTSAASGNISLYADKTIGIAAPLACSMTAGVSCGINGTLASVNGFISANINALFASMDGVYSATITAIKSNFISYKGTVVAARDGEVSLQGRHIEIGKHSGPVAGKAYNWKEWTTGGQCATERVDIRADDMVVIEPGKATDKVVGAPVKITATAKSVRAETKKTALQMDDKAALYAGKSVIALDGNRIKLFQAKTPIKDAVDTAIKTAEKAREAAYEAADEIETTYDKATNLLIGAAVGATAGAVAGAIGGSQIETDTSGKAAIGTVLAAAGLEMGAIMGAGTALAITKVVEKIATSKAKKAARKAADAAYKTAVATAGVSEQAAIGVEGLNPTNPKIDIAADSITLSVGTSKLKISATGVEITTAPGMDVKVNGHPFKKGVMPSLNVM